MKNAGGFKLSPYLQKLVDDYKKEKNLEKPTKINAKKKKEKNLYVVLETYYDKETDDYIHGIYKTKEGAEKRRERIKNLNEKLFLNPSYISVLEFKVKG